MHIQPFRITPHNAHYEGRYSSREMEWRRICAIDKVNNLQAVLGNTCVETVLEVGCGTGAVLSELRGRGVGFRHVGIDMTDPHIHAEPDSRDLTLMLYDGVKLPFEDASFDLVYASHVVEHVPDPRGFISELSRVSKKAIYIEIPCEQHCRTTRATLQNTVAIGHINVYSPESFCLLLQTSGLIVENLQLFDHSLAVHSFHDGMRMKGRLKKMVRGAILGFSPTLASRIFTYHCGTLCLARHL